MTYNKTSANLLRKFNRGFTLIELVIVIIILGVLSATAIPKFFTSNGFSEYTYRSEVITKLRLIQTRAMQQVNDSCHQLIVTSNKLGKATCDTPPVFVDQTKKRATLVEIDISDNITFSPLGLNFSFDDMGRPQGCNQPCDITISGEQLLKVRIESEGYIHAL